MYRNIESLCYALGISIVLGVSCISIKKKRKEQHVRGLCMTSFYALVSIFENVNNNTICVCERERERERGKL